MLNHYCAITRIDYKEFRQCLEKEQSALRSSAQRRCATGKILIMLAMMFTITMAYIQGTYDVLRNLLRLVIRCQQLKGIKKFQLHEKISRMQIKLMGIFAKNYNEAHSQKETKDFDKVLLYNVKSVDCKDYVAGKQQDHYCNHCLQQKPMRAAATAAVENERVPEIKYKDDAQLIVQPNQRQKQIVLHHTNSLYTINTYKSDFRLIYLKLICILIVYNINVQYLKRILRVAPYSIVLSSKVKNSSLSLALQRCSKIKLCTRFFHHVLLNNMLI